MQPPPQRAFQISPSAVDHRAVDAAAAPRVIKRGGLAARQAGRRIEIDAEQHVLRRCRRNRPMVPSGEKQIAFGIVTSVIEARQLAAMQRIDRAQPPLGLAAHGADPERAGRMDPGIVRTRCGIVGFERTVQRHPPIRRVADIEAIFGDEELAMRVDPPKRAAHHVERMDGGPPGVEPASNSRRSTMSNHQAVSVAAS